MARQRRIPTPSWEKDHGIGGGFSGSRLQVLAAIGAALLVVAALGAIGFGFLYDELRERDRPNTTAIQVGDTRFTVRDFTNRAKMYVTEFTTTNYQVVVPSVSVSIQEQVVIIKYAGEKNVSATDDDVKAEIAKLLGIEATDPNFDQRLSEELTKTGLSDQQYRDYARGRALQGKLKEQFKTDLPATAESVHYRQILVPDQALADEIKAEIDAGGDFVALAAQHSTDTATKDTGGDKGWAPLGFLPDNQEELFFSLDLNQVVTIPAQGGTAVYVYQVTEKDAEHPVDEDKKDTLAQQNYNEWVAEKIEAEDVDDQMDFTNGNFDKIRYVINNAGLSIQ